ncbi:MAG: aspartate kinase, partial [Gaiellales bacterium]
MTTIVQKYGGTSVASAERIKRVAERVAQTAEEGNRVCVVVSAMGDMTDELVALSSEVAA